MLLILLNPYFHGTTKRIGAPFWGKSSLPYNPTAKIVRGFIASSIRNPSRYGNGILPKLLDCCGNWSGSNSVSNSTYLLLEVKPACFSSEARLNPTHGTTIAHPSTHRKRYILSSSGIFFIRESISSVRDF